MKRVIFFVIMLGLACLSHAEPAEPTDSIAPAARQLQEVSVTASRSSGAMTGVMTGRLTLKLDKLSQLPRLFGVADIVRTLQLMPGVQTTGELSSGIYIRGGDPSHNNILLNGAPVYNSSHLLGFFSLFNSDHYSTVTLSKSYLSPQHGGRLASVLEVNASNELAARPSVKGMAGLISSQASLALPLGSKQALYLSGRTTYLRPILNLLQDNDGMKMFYDFSDVNLTYVARPTPGARITVNGYFGNDRVDISEYLYQVDSKIKWNNGAASARWEQSLADNSRLALTAYFSWYRNHIAMRQNQVLIVFPSEIKEPGLKLDYNVRLSRQWALIAGLDYAFRHMSPQVPQVDNLYGTQHGNDGRQNYATHELAAYASLRTTWNSFVITDVGLRCSALLHTGPFTHRAHDDLGMATSATALGGGVVKRYGSIEPRIGVTLMPSPGQRVRLSYCATSQYVCQVATSGLGFPTDYWMPASMNVKPQRAHAATAGYFCTLGRKEYELSVEGYYRKMRHLLEYDGELFDMLNRQYDAESGLIEGDGEAYGVELMLQKTAGRFTGWVSYTLGWAWRQFPQIEQGRRFPAKYDRRHDLSVAAHYKLNDRWDLSATFTYATGCAVTMPDQFYIVGENLINHYGKHNGERMPAYHRLDLSANLWLRRSATTESGINFSLYNAYARNNPVFVAVRVRPNEERTRIAISYRSQSLYNIIPSISYFFKF